MFGMKKLGVNAYADVGLETGVVDASPLKLTIMLYEGAISACILAQQAVQQKNYVVKGESLSKAVSIIENGLRASLNKRAGGEIANSLDQLYQYMTRSLMSASLHLDVAKIQEIQTLLHDLKGAWETLEKNGVPQQPLTAQRAFGAVVNQKTNALQQANAMPRLAVAGA